MTDYPNGPRSARTPASRRPTPTPRGRRDSLGALPSSRRWPRRALIWINVLVALCIVGTASAYGYVQWRLGQIHKEKLSSLTSINGGKPFTMLIVGSDSRSALAANDPSNSQFGSASQTPGQRSDTIMLARVAPASRQLELLSIPRDLWVNVPGQGPNRINSAFDTSANLLVQTIQNDLGIPINHFVEVNFDSFQAIADAVGGISFYFPTPAKDGYSGLNVPQAGCVSLTGSQALAFVRSRHYEYYQNGEWHFEAESDLARIQRQQTFVKKMITKAEGQFTNPIALNDVIGGVTKNLTVDTGFSTTLLLDLAKDFHSLNASTVPTLTLPNYAYTTAGGADVLGLQQPQAAQAIAAFNAFGNTPPATATTAPAKKSTSTTKPPVTAPPVTVAPSSVAVEVANGTGVSGQAALMTGFLTQHGYTASTTLQSPGYNYTTTQVLYAPDSLTAARQVAALIPGGATLVPSASLAPTQYNVEVVTGSSYSHAGGSTTSSSSSTSPTSSTTIPGTNPSTYVLPGMPAGQTPPAC